MSGLEFISLPMKTHQAHEVSATAGAENMVMVNTSSYVVGVKAAKKLDYYKKKFLGF